MPEGGAGAEVGGGGAETGSSISAPVEEAVETASQGLAGVIEGMENTQDAGSILGGLAEGSIGPEAEEPVVEAPSTEEPAVEESVAEQTPEPAVEATTPETPADEPVTSETPVADEAVTTEEVTAEADELTTKVEALTEQMKSVTDQMSELQAKQDVIMRESGQAIGEIPGLEDALKALLEKATPEQKKPLNLLLLLLQVLLTLGTSVAKGEVPSGGDGKKKEPGDVTNATQQPAKPAPAPQVAKPQQAQPI